MRKNKLWKTVLAAFMAQAIIVAGGIAGNVKEVMAEETSQEKQRIIITQDGEVDDKNSLVHTLLYTNDFDLQGFIFSSSSLHYSGDDATEPKRWPGTEWMNEFMDAYAEVYDNLSIHAKGYPEPDQLRSVTKIGNIKNQNDMEENTEGSDLIKRCILDDDERTLYIAVGGGMNTLGRALKSIEEEYKERNNWDELHKKISEKVVIRAWGQQDDVYGEYIGVEWPDIKLVDISRVSSPYGYMWANAGLSDAATEKMKGDWMYKNIENGHGPLLDKYVTWGDGTYLEGEAESDQFGSNEELLGSLEWWGGRRGGLSYSRYDFLSEGDTPDWIWLIQTGLRSDEDESYGGWGGRLVKSGLEGNDKANYYAAAPDDSGMVPFIEAIQNDFAARADWCITDKYEDANHEPVVKVTEGIDLAGKAGDTVTLHAEAKDPDGDKVTFKWWQYAEADTYQEHTGAEGKLIPIELQVSDTGEKATFTIPEDAKIGDTIHVVLEGTDDGEHNLTRYQRVIVTVEQ